MNKRRTKKGDVGWYAFSAMPYNRTVYAPRNNMIFVCFTKVEVVYCGKKHMLLKDCVTGVKHGSNIPVDTPLYQTREEARRAAENLAVKYVMECKDFSKYHLMKILTPAFIKDMPTLLRRRKEVSEWLATLENGEARISIVEV